MSSDGDPVYYLMHAAKIPAPAAAVLLLAGRSLAAAAAPYLPPAMPPPKRGALLPWCRGVTYYGGP